MKREGIATFTAAAIHAGLFFVLGAVPPQVPVPPPPMEVTVVVTPPPPAPVIAEEPTPAVVSRPGPPAPAAAKQAGKPRRRSSSPSPAAEVTAPAVATGEVAVAEPSVPEAEPAAETSSPTAGGGGNSGLPLGSGPVPVADYSQVALPVAPAVLAKFAGRDVVVDLFVDEDGHVHHTARIEGVDGRVDKAVAEVSKQFLFVPARDASGKATAGVVTYRFKVRAVQPGAARSQVLAPMLASSALSSVSGGAHGLPERGDDAVASAPRTAEQRAFGRALARGIGGTMFGAGDAVVQPSRGKSGLPKQRQVSQLTRRDREQLCKWALATRGGVASTSKCKFVEDRELDTAAARLRWQEGVKSPDGDVNTPWWYGTGRIEQDNFEGRYSNAKKQQTYNAPSRQGEDRVQAIEVTSGRMTAKMEGTERVAYVESEAVCVAGLEEAKVCHVTVEDLEACADAMASDPCTGGESYACVKIQKCGSVAK
jgi:hypothetical protein